MEKTGIQVVIAKCCGNLILFVIAYSDEFELEPVFEVPPPKYTAEQILRILLDPCISNSKICNVIGMSKTN